MLIYHAVGNWPEGRVHAAIVPDDRAHIPEVEAMIDAAWSVALSRPGMMRLFDGPICRLESWQADGNVLRLSMSRSSYKIFLGTHIAHPQIFQQFGRQVMCNPLGVSCSLETADGFLMLGRRNLSVAYYPDRLHPFAGSMEPPVDGTPPNIFAEARRELFEELGLVADDLTDISCVGLVEDTVLRHPELIMRVRTSRTRQQIEEAVDAEEHHASVATKTTRSEIEQRLRDPLLTPVAVAALTLWGREAFGVDWFERR